ncbi:hypothetical protein HDU81_006874 [Chytriomyces hyalinus]|nr:hypothetical protein HDU81_006874 [Chytriomyces hyalinus]
MPERQMADESEGRLRWAPSEKFDPEILFKIMIITSLSLALSLSLATAVHAQSRSTSYCTAARNFCLNVEIVADSADAVVTVQSTEGGWAAIAFGTLVMGGNVPCVVGWTAGSGNGSVASFRTLGTHVMPEFSLDANPQPRSATVLELSNALTSYSVRVPSSLFSAASIPCVYATSNTPPQNLDSPSAPFGVHDDKGSFTLRFSTASSQVASSASPRASATSVAGENTVNNATGTVAASMGSTTLAASATSSASKTNTSTSKTSTTTASGLANSGIGQGSSATQSRSSYCRDQTNTFCVTVVRDDGVGMVAVTMWTSYSGWMAIGTGSVMSGSNMFIAWQSNSAGMIVSQRTASGHNTPTVFESSTPLFKIESSPPTSVIVPKDAQLQVTFSVTTRSGIFSTLASTPLIFGVSSTPPVGPNFPNATIVQHNVFGPFTLDVSKLNSVNSGAATPESESTKTLKLAHGLAMFFAWGVFPFIFIFVARYLKHRLGRKWYWIHLAGMLYGVCGLTVAGLVFIELTVEAGVSRFTEAGVHGFLGLAICFVLLPLQCIMGFLSNAFFKTDRTTIPWWDQVHWWTGRTLVMLGFAQIQLGLTAHDAALWVIVAFWAWAFLVSVVLFGVVGEWYLGGASHHIASEKQQDSTQMATYTGLAAEEEGWVVEDGVKVDASADETAKSNAARNSNFVSEHSFDDITDASTSYSLLDRSQTWPRVRR